VKIAFFILIVCVLICSPRTSEDENCGVIQFVIAD